MTTSRLVGAAAGRCGLGWARLAAPGYLSAAGQSSVLSPPQISPDLTRPHITDMELSYCSTSSSNCSSLTSYSSEKPTEVFWRQYRRGRKSLSLWRLFKLIFSKQEARQNDALDRTDSLHRFYEELYHRQNSRLQSTLLRADSSIMADISHYQSYNQEEEESLYYVPFC